MLSAEDIRKKLMEKQKGQKGKKNTATTPPNAQNKEQRSSGKKKTGTVWGTTNKIDSKSIN